ncbi:UNVERIFIED_CONTAM: hypothetical protein PYX00_011235 [Menopon gallinae]|uniref:Uncharacterized protein n=1 Tax=Menopon gallinae TaxID=328185 RepID=A0AAW2H6D3_9NEOP
MKQRFSFLDVRAVVNELQPALENAYVQNVYSDRRRFIIKFNTGSLLVEPGVRIHLVEKYEHGISHFAKAMRSLQRKKLRGVSQCGFDRVVVLDFGERRMYAEFFSAGNIVITDTFNVVVHILRTIPGVCELGQTYVANNAELNLSVPLFCSMPFKKFIPVDSMVLSDIQRQLEDALETGLEAFRKELCAGLVCRSGDASPEDVTAMLEKTALGCTCSAGALCRHAALAEKVCRFGVFMERLLERMGSVGGFGMLVLQGGQPCNLLPLEVRTEKETRVFGTFNEACQRYFVEKAKPEVSKSAVAEAKQHQRVRELERDVEACREKAELMGSDPLAAEIFGAFHAFRESRVGWDDILAFKKKEDAEGNPVSLAIKKVNFRSGTAQIRLGDTDIDVCMDKNIHYNISRYYEKAKASELKIERTRKAIEKLAEKVVAEKKHVAVEKRKAYWFEKFHFVLLPGKIVLSGKNAQQNEILVKKFLRGLYFHCSVQGGSSVILETFDCEVEIGGAAAGGASRLSVEADSIRTAGEVALCMSKCWDMRIPHPVFYVGADQVSKSAPAGEYLPKGSFLIRGKKNDVQVYRLEYGVGILFRVEGPLVGAADSTHGPEASERLYFSTDPRTRKIVHGMVVTGPWSLLRTFKYRAKLVQGSAKRGKLVKELQALFSKESEGAENEFIRGIHVDELTEYRKRIGRKENPFPSDSALHDMVDNEYEAFHKSETAAAAKLARVCWLGIVQVAVVTLANIVILDETVQDASRRLLVYLAGIAGADLQKQGATEHVLGNAIIFVVFLLVIDSMVFVVCDKKNAALSFASLAALNLFLARRCVFTRASFADPYGYSRKCIQVLVNFVYTIWIQYVISVVLLFLKRFDVSTLPVKMQKIVAGTGFQNRIFETFRGSSKINAFYWVIGFFRPICLVGNVATKLSPEDVSGILCHEIGHAQDTTLTLVLWISAFAFHAILEFVPYFFARVSDVALAQSPFRLVSVEVLYYVNFLSVVVAYFVVINMLRRRSEYFADRYSFKCVPMYDIRRGLFHLSLCNEIPLYMPLPLVVLLSGHPSTHMRIRALQDKAATPATDGP